MEFRILGTTFTGHRPGHPRAPSPDEGGELRHRGTREWVLDHLPVKKKTVQADEPDVFAFQAATGPALLMPTAEIDRLARAWGTQDMSSVLAVARALENEFGSADRMPQDAAKVYLHRKTDLRFCDLAAAQGPVIRNNPDALARVLLHPEEVEVLDGHITSTGMRAGRLPGGGINFLASGAPFASNFYNASDTVLCTLDEVLSRGGKVYSDQSSFYAHAVLVAMPPGVGLPIDVSL